MTLHWLRMACGCWERVGYDIATGKPVKCSLCRRGDVMTPRPRGKCWTDPPTSPVDDWGNDEH